MLVNCNINDIITFLQKKREEGYETVEIIDDVRANGWIALNPKLEFIFCKQEPKVIGIDVRTSK